jgi:hypothetical protein
MRAGPQSRRRLRIWLSVRAVAAIGVLFAITAGILADSRCHRLERTQVHPGLWSAVPPGGQDPCAGACVPDCYCCSQSVTPGPAVLPPDAGPVSLTVALLPAATPAGIRPVPYRPPLRLA